jgi:hypothetical protein
MATEVLTELWKIKDDIAKEHGYDIDNLAKYLMEKQLLQGVEEANIHPARQPNTTFNRTPVSPRRL